MRTRHVFMLVVVALLLSPVAAAAAPIVITFEGFENTIYNSPITRLGFDIGNPVNQEQHFHEITSTNYGLISNGTGVLLNDRDTEIFVIATGGSGATFGLVSVDVATAANNNPAVGINIRGYLNSVLVGTIPLSNLGTVYTTLYGASLGSVDRLVFDGISGSGGFALDNLTLATGSASTVPDPGSSLLLLGMGLLGLRAWKPRR